MTKHTVTIDDDGDIIIDGPFGDTHCSRFGVYAPALMSKAEGKAALADALTGSPQPPDGVEVLGWVDDAGDGAGAWVMWGDQIPDGWRRTPRRGSEWSRYGVAIAYMLYLARPIPEPATERVPWWEAVGREVEVDGVRSTIESVACGDGAGPTAFAYHPRMSTADPLVRLHTPVRGDGTVEVLVDGGQR